MASHKAASAEVLFSLFFSALCKTDALAHWCIGVLSCLFSIVFGFPSLRSPQPLTPKGEPTDAQSSELQKGYFNKNFQSE
jgi:hypothetical protein